MTIWNPRFEHEVLKARHKASLVETLDEVYDVLAGFSSEPTDQAICVATVEFNQPEIGLPTPHCSTPFDEKVNRAVALSTQLLKFMYKELVPQQDEPNALTRYPWSFSAIDFPGSDMGKPKISAAPIVNIVMFIPGAQVERFRDFSLRLPIRKRELKELGVKKVDFVWVDDCKGDFGYSLHHLLRFTDSWEPIVHRNRSDMVTTFVKEFCHWHVAQ